MTILTLDQALPKLKYAYQEHRLIPFLGAGFSIPLGLPSWSELIASIASRLGFEPVLFQSHGRFEQLAAYCEIAPGNNLSDLIHDMTVQFNSRAAEDKRKDSRTHQALAGLDWHTIYTTNYDKHIEGALEDFGKQVAVLSSVEDFQASRSREACEVIKFHGTLSHPETLVLTESQYFERMALDAPADQRLRSDLLSNSFLFIGYSFSDINIRYIWYRMQQLREKASRGRRRPETRECFFATHGARHVQPDLLGQWNINVITLDPVEPNCSVAELLESIG